MTKAGSIVSRIQEQMGELTRAERQIAFKILENHPVSGLGTISDIAHSAGVSSPTVVRMVQKLGFRGFPEFQSELKKELEASITDPIMKHDRWVETAPDEHILNRFAEAVSENIRQSLAHVDADQFDEACALLADDSRGVFVVGGRITRAIADYFFLHLQMARPRATLIQPISNSWPHYLLEVEEGDVVVVFDIRRYENSTLKLAELVAERGAKIILFTDHWRSPVHKRADYCFSLRIEAPSAWDSSVATILLVETMIAKLQELTWAGTRPRLEALEEMFDKTKFFRKFS